MNLRMMLLQRLVCTPNARTPSPRYAAGNPAVALCGKFDVHADIQFVGTGGSFTFDLSSSAHDTDTWRVVA
jgi:hypothetical protein